MGATTTDREVSELRLIVVIVLIDDTNICVMFVLLSLQKVEVLAPFDLL